MAQTSLWTQSLIKGENIWKKVDYDSPTGTTLVMDTELNGTNQTVHNHTHQGDIVYVDGVSIATKSGGCYTVPYTIENVTYYKLNH